MSPTSKASFTPSTAPSCSQCHWEYGTAFRYSSSLQRTQCAHTVCSVCPHYWSCELPTSNHCRLCDDERLAASAVPHQSYLEEARRRRSGAPEPEERGSDWDSTTSSMFSQPATAPLLVPLSPDNTRNLPLNRPDRQLNWTLGTNMFADAAARYLRDAEQNSVRHVLVPTIGVETPSSSTQAAFPRTSSYAGALSELPKRTRSSHRRRD
jgi:hypothetical protein